MQSRHHLAANTLISNHDALSSHVIGGAVSGNLLIHTPPALNRCVKLSFFVCSLDDSMWPAELLRLFGRNLLGLVRPCLYGMVGLGAIAGRNFYLIFSFYLSIKIQW